MFSYLKLKRFYYFTVTKLYIQKHICKKSACPKNPFFIIFFSNASFDIKMSLKQLLPFNFKYDPISIFGQDEKK